VNPNGGTALGIHGTITSGDCTSWFNSSTLQDAGSTCGGGSGGANTTLSNLTSPTALNEPLNNNTATYAGSAFLNLGGTASGVSNLVDMVDQTTGNIFRFNMSGATYNGIWDPVVSFGWNSATGGGIINPSFGALWQQMEGDYNLSGAGTDTMEWHNILEGTNGAYVRWMSCQWSMQTGIEHFCNYNLDLGMNWSYGAAGDGTPVTASAAWSSPNGGTFTYTIGTGTWPWDYEPTASYVTISSCSVSAYNFAANSQKLIAAGGVGGTTFTITGVGSNPGSSATGCSVQGGIGAHYASIGSNSTNGMTTAGNIPIQGGGGITENNGGNSVAGITLTSESGVGGGVVSGNPTIHAGGSTLTNGVSSSLNGLVLNGGSFSNWECNGSNCYFLGTNAIHGLGLYQCSVCSLTIPTIFHWGSNSGLDIATNYTSDSNHSGWIFTTNGGSATGYGIGYQTGSGGPTPMTTYAGGGWSNIEYDVYGDATKDEALTSGGVAISTLGASTSTNVCFATGNVLAGCTSLTRYKDNIQTFDPAAALAEALKLRPVTYISKTNGRPEMGFLAEEVEKVEPRLATYGQVEPHGEVRDPKDLGKILTPATNQEIVLNGVDYGHVTALLTAAFQEYIKQQQAQLTTLQSEVEALKAAQTK
jgi:Chaperone of endosialidase